MIKIKEMVGIIKNSFKDENIYYNKNRGSFVEIDEYYLYMGEEKKSLLYWQKELVKLGREILNEDGVYIICPSRKLINEYDLMYKFLNEKLFEDEKKELMDIIQGVNPLKRFKCAIEGIYYENIWEILIEEEIEKMCIKWCKENEFTYEL